MKKVKNLMAAVLLFLVVAGVVLMYLATALTVISLADYLLRNWKVLEISFK